MSQQELAEAVEARATEFGVPGMSVGILVDGQEIFASHGVTSLADPTPVDEKTLFHLASVSKTFTATALMRLVAEGKVDLDAPVRRYVPELRLADEEAVERITVLNLLNHTAGLDWNLIDDGRGDRSLAGLVAKLHELPLIAPPGTRASYSQAGYNLVGRIIEKVTDLPFEQAVASLVLEPVGLSDTVYGLAEVMVRKFAVGYNRGDDGALEPARPWGAFKEGARADNPGGGLASSASDLLRWARFLLGDGKGVLPAEALHRMRERTVELRSSSLGDGFGICWFLHDLDGVQGIGHGGSGTGQFAELLIVPERNFAVVALSNVGPDGYTCNQSVLKWALRRYLGVVEKEPEPVPYDEALARQVTGRYDIDAMNVDIATDGTRLTLAVEIKPEIREASDEEMPPGYPPATIAFLPGDGDEYLVLEGGLKGERGYFSRDPHGTVTGIDLGGRLFGRVRRDS
ncbi:serine hydrolase domain-containing protein [Streptomyces spectabilis]|uniref:Class A beta-lactamase-related serine hydrolase n=1 Tax=Streptomyces spectabilis TaxID=68270 RepID=A0A5P2X4G8_STRST|nr:serine hydrolase domain-containing protein [Streptomyces spectabilis]UUW33146.1 beta-lactamase [Streptomyces sp.]MBB5101280.1 CubicO group peptidase (beta-lactamase class C family) [Streptomyces spectabilis]MCI3900479.1 beta-lactamase family protein [Streptomyces spectabilis]QEV58055.1 class A beta-lactamase-related serine hydrolase [Streptomyces spectabilis]GGV10365.1 penicillin-binding protein [Streptomyces spectabilis]